MPFKWPLGIASVSALVAKMECCRAWPQLMQWRWISRPWFSVSVGAAVELLRLEVGRENESWWLLWRRCVGSLVGLGVPPIFNTSLR